MTSPPRRAASARTRLALSVADENAPPDWWALRRRAPDEAPSGYAGGGELTLMRTADGWVVVSDMSWIT